MKKIHALSIIKDSMLPTLNNELELEFVDDHYELKNYDKIVNKVDAWIETSSQFVYSPEDRAEIKALKAANNKLTSGVTQVINTQMSNLMSVAQSQKSTLTSKLSELSSVLSRGVDEEDKRYRATKKEALAQVFEESKSDYKSLKDSELEFDDIFMSQWLNRSVSEKKAISAINDRLKSIDYLVTSDACPSSDVAQIVDALDYNDWSSFESLDYLIKLEKQRQERELQRLIDERLEKQRQLEREKQLAEAQGVELVTTTVEKLPDVMIKISGEDSKKAQNLLKAGGINYVLI